MEEAAESVPTSTGGITRRTALKAFGTAAVLPWLSDEGLTMDQEQIRETARYLNRGWVLVGAAVEDRTPSPQHVDEFEAILRSNGKQSEFYRYSNAGHGFFAVDRTSYRVIAAVDGWERIASFFARHIALEV